MTMQDPSFTALRALLKQEPPVRSFGPDGCYVYGAGNFGRRIARELHRLGHAVRGFIDRKAHAAPVVDGLPCLHPDDLAADVHEADYVHGLMHHYASSRDVADWAAARGFRALWFPADLLTLPGFQLDNYWLASAPVLQAEAAALERLYDRLADDHSRSVLSDLLAYRLSTDPRVHPAVSATDTYRQDFLNLRDRPLTFVDGGAYTGDSMVELLEYGVTVADWLAFEPDLVNMAALRATAAAHDAALGGYTLMGAGLGNTNGRMRFQAGDGAGSRIVGPGETTRDDTVEIETVRLDDVVRRRGNLYIKLDIEGAETDALRGMAAHLAERPTLAISAYHLASDLWEIPRILDELYERPCLHLRQHEHHGFGTVLYVTPG